MLRSSLVALALSTALVACGDHATGSNDADAGADASDQGGDAPPAIDAAPDAPPTPDTPHLVASNVYQCAINATDLFCFTSTDILDGGSIWTAPKAGGTQTTIVQHTLRAGRMAANATNVVTQSSPGQMNVTRFDIDGTDPTLIAPAVSMDIMASRTVLLGNELYFVSGTGNGQGPKLYDFDITSTHNIWGDIGSTDPGGNLGTDGTAPFYTKNSQIVSPGLPTITPSISTLDDIYGLDADHDAVYLVVKTGGANAEKNAIYRVSRADGAGTELVSVPVQGFTWVDVVVGANDVYWSSREAALSKVSKQGGAVTVIDAGTLPEIQIFADETYVWWINTNNELYRVKQ